MVLCPVDDKQISQLILVIDSKYGEHDGRMLSFVLEKVSIGMPDESIFLFLISNEIIITLPKLIGNIDGNIFVFMRHQTKHFCGHLHHPLLTFSCSKLIILVHSL